MREVTEDDFRMPEFKGKKPEDYDYNVIPKEVIDAFDELHEKLTKINAIISYEPKTQNFRRNVSKKFKN
ncbi:MAG TPA: hypothetical protein VFM18_05455 [Methanosarcina sp.]|nr:hypothetical protein [Methanosarcina sp.]